MPIVVLPVLIFVIILFTIAFCLNLWAGLFLAIWLIASITWFIMHIGDKYSDGAWYDWIIGSPVLLIAYVWYLADKMADKNEKKDNKS